MEWAERIEQDWAEGRSITSVARVEPFGGHAGRTKTTALQDTARLVGVSVSAAYEARRIKLANETLFAELKAGLRSLRSGLDELTACTRARQGAGDIGQRVLYGLEVPLLNPETLCVNGRGDHCGDPGRRPAGSRTPGGRTATLSR